METLAPTEREGLPSVIRRLAGVLESDTFPTGERARLRRMRPSAAPPLTFYRFALRYLPDDWDLSLARQKDWITIVAGMALMSPYIHSPQDPMGKVLAVQGYSEARLERFLAADEDVMRTLALRICRFLAAKGKPFNWLDLASLLLSRGDEQHRRVQERIARFYYRQLEENASTKEKAQ
ncbi:MAG: type I-E CRISPR-associated protein Cse2/CasB [Bacillota bacterium]|nr:type I-E CRISPR-associated protein Cse2/CasB [Bacillota bacterium]